MLHFAYATAQEIMHINANVPEEFIINPNTTVTLCAYRDQTLIGAIFLFDYYPQHTKGKTNIGGTVFFGVVGLVRPFLCKEVFEFVKRVCFFELNCHCALIFVYENNTKMRAICRRYHGVEKTTLKDFYGEGDHSVLIAFPLTEMFVYNAQSTYYTVSATIN